MAKKLQEKEFFIPLHAGVQTEGDAHTMGSPTIVTFNADFSTKDLVKEREPLAVFSGNAQADTETAIASDVISIAPTDNGVVLWGNGTYELSSIGSLSLTSGGYTLGGSLLSTEEIIYADNVSANYSDHLTFAAISTASGNVFVWGNASIGGGPVSESGSYAQETGVVTQDLNAFAAVRGTNAAYHGRISTGGSNAIITRINATANTTTTNVALSASGNSLTIMEEYDDNVVLIGCPYTTNVFRDSYFISAVNVVSSTEVGHYDISANLTPNTTVTSNDLFYDGTNIYLAVTTNAGSSFIGNFNLDIGGAGLTLSQGVFDSTRTNTILNMGMCEVNSTSMLITYTESNTAGTIGGDMTRIYGRIFTKSNVALTVDVTNSILRGHRLAARPYKRKDDQVIITTSHIESLAALTNSGEQERFGLFDSIMSWRLDTERQGDSFNIEPVGRNRLDSYPQDAKDRFYTETQMAMPRLQSFSGSDGETYLYHLARVKTGPSSSNLQLFKFDDRGKPLRSRQFGGYTIMPGGSPRAYDGAMCNPLGNPCTPRMFVDGAVNGSGNFTLDGGLGTYTYATSILYRDNLGRKNESSPSISDSITITNTNTNVTIRTTGPALAGYHYRDSQLQVPLNKMFVRTYRSDADGSYMYLIDERWVSGTTVTLAQYDSGGSYGSNTNGTTKIYTAPALYTLNGTLPNDPAHQHSASCIYQGRYAYARHGTSTIYYSKAMEPGIGIEFSDLLRIDAPSRGGRINALEAPTDKLFAFKDRAIFAIYGEPLNNAGAGQGVSDARLVSEEYGALDQYKVCQAGGLIFFINSVDGLIYAISGESVQYVGGPVRHYCEIYSYTSCWVNPRNSSIRFASETSGAPTLSYDYKYNKWSAFGGRYANGIKCGEAARAGSAYGAGTKLVDVIIDVNSNAYIQDVTRTYGTTEDCNLAVETSWIPLNDIAGYGKFYSWTLVGNKSNTNCNIICNTAYAYEPYWVDSVEVNLTTNFATFDAGDHFGSMTNSTWVDKSLKLDVDGSRHKTDAVRIRIATNSADRASAELVGIRCRVGVKPGAYRTGDSRSTT